jgi:hypothetical protein
MDLSEKLSIRRQLEGPNSFGFNVLDIDNTVHPFMLEFKEELEMINSIGTERKNDPYKFGPFKKLGVQDAIAVIAIYAARIDPDSGEEEIKRIKSIAEHSPVCVERKKDIFSRINLFVNEMRRVDREKALEIAIEVLTPELRKTAFELATEVVISGNALPNQKRMILENLVTKMSIETKLAAKAIERLNKEDWI